jgi:hydrogenase maturation protein HypF
MCSNSGIVVRVFGLVQGVGFRPTVWRLARELGLDGEVRNDGAGVVIRLWGEGQNRERFLERLPQEVPPLACIDNVETLPLNHDDERPDGFHIVHSGAGAIRTGIVPDAAICSDCRREILDSSDRRYRYPFTNCTHCGPRFSIVRAIPYDRANTSMDVFTMCAACQGEYENPADRRFHAQPNACPVCGPRIWLEDRQGGEAPQSEDIIADAARLIRKGEIVAIKGIGGFHLACDATNEEAVAELRRRKGRYHKPFALMARDVGMTADYCFLNEQERQLLQNAAAPIVLLRQREDKPLAPSVAPAQDTLGFMLPYTPLHLLLMEKLQGPIVLTSGNPSEEPQLIANETAQEQLAQIADYFLLHDREILNRVDDSVVRLMAGKERIIRRARGYAPASLLLPPGFEGASGITALGGELKNSFCLLKDGKAILSHHLGDLENPESYRAFQSTLRLFNELFQHQAETVAVDLHPGYRSSRLGRQLAERKGLRLLEVQHHHAHVAACMAENGWGRDDGPVLGVVLDGLGYGPDDTLWGGEFLLASYGGFERLGHIKTVPMPGGTQAILEPWRSAYAQLLQGLGMEALRPYQETEWMRYLSSKPLTILDQMMAQGVNSPLTSSAGRLFDAVAAVLGICRDRIHYEGQAAMELEAIIPPGLEQRVEPYPFQIDRSADGPALLNPAPMWSALLQDYLKGRATGEIAAAFHCGLAQAVAGMAATLSDEAGVNTVALSGGVFQNRILFERVVEDLESRGVQVLTHSRVPTNDSGISLGQAVIAESTFW